jgi:hypothetical protein
VFLDCLSGSAVYKYRTLRENQRLIVRNVLGSLCSVLGQV